jgi:hypothetical protein
MTDTPAGSNPPLDNNITLIGSASAAVMVGYSNVFKNGIVSFD